MVIEQDLKWHNFKSIKCLFDCIIELVRDEQFNNAVDFIEMLDLQQKKECVKHFDSFKTRSPSRSEAREMILDSI